MIGKLFSSRWNSRNSGEETRPVFGKRHSRYRRHVEPSVVAARNARGFWPFSTCDRVRPFCQAFACGHFQKPLAGMVIRGSGPNLNNERIGSLAPAGFPDPDLFDRCAHSGLLTSPFTDVRLFRAAPQSCSYGQRRIPIILVLGEHGPNRPGHLVRQRRSPPAYVASLPASAPARIPWRSTCALASSAVTSTR